jgi:hypothetical protein
VKKALLIMLCTLLVLSLAACSEGSQAEQTQTEEAPTTETSEEASAEPSTEVSAAVSTEVSAEPTPAETESSETEPAEDFTEVGLGEISFEIDNKYKYDEDTENEMVDFQFEPNVAWGSVVVLQKMDMLEDADEDTQLDLGFTALTSGFDEVETLAEEDTTIAGVPAKMGQYIVTHAGTTAQFIPAEFYGEEDAYAFMLYIADGVDGSEYISDFGEMLDSVTFN